MTLKTTHVGGGWQSNCLCVSISLLYEITGSKANRGKLHNFGYILQL